MDAETGQRGFLLTGEARYLEPYDRAVRLVPAEMATLNRLTGPSQDQPGADVARLGSLVDRKMAELRRTIEIRKNQGVGPATEVVLGDEGKQAMDEVRAICAVIQRNSESELREVQARVVTATAGALLVTVMGSLALIVLLVAGYMAIGRGTLAREAALAEARSARDLLSTTLASIGDAVISTDAESRILFANPVALSLLKASQPEISGKPLDEVFNIVNEHTRAKVESPAAKVLREGRVVGLANHTVLIAQDGTEIPIDDSGAPVRGEDGVVEGTVMVFRDVSERKRAEATLHLLAAIVESSDDAVFSDNLEGVITSWNPGAERMFGYTADEVTGQPISVLIPRDRQHEITEILERIRRGERLNHFETVRRAKDGSLIEVSLTISPIHDAAGKITGASKIARDITGAQTGGAGAPGERRAVPGHLLQCRGGNRPPFHGRPVDSFQRRGVQHHRLFARGTGRQNFRRYYSPGRCGGGLGAGAAPGGGRVPELFDGEALHKKRRRAGLGEPDGVADPRHFRGADVLRVRD